MITEYAEQEARQLAAAKESIQTLIDKMPDNENIKRLGSTVNAFTMSFSEMTKHDNWTPGFHDFKAQYALVLSRLESVSSVSEFVSFISKAVEDKFIKKGKYVHKLHPDVVAELRNLL